MLFLHGGGYIAGDLQYAKGAGSIFADRTRSACSARIPAGAGGSIPRQLGCSDRLPVALEQGVRQKIIVAGESAGGGLAYALCLRLRALGLEDARGRCGDFTLD